LKLLQILEKYRILEEIEFFGEFTNDIESLNSNNALMYDSQVTDTKKIFSPVLCEISDKLESEYIYENEKVTNYNSQEKLPELNNDEIAVKEIMTKKSIISIPTTESMKPKTTEETTEAITIATTTETATTATTKETTAETATTTIITTKETLTNVDEKDNDLLIKMEKEKLFNKTPQSESSMMLNSLEELNIPRIIIKLYLIGIFPPHSLTLLISPEIWFPILPIHCVENNFIFNSLIFPYWEKLFSKNFCSNELKTNNNINSNDKVNRNNSKNNSNNSNHNNNNNNSNNINKRNNNKKLDNSNNCLANNNKLRERNNFYNLSIFSDELDIIFQYDNNSNLTTILEYDYITFHQVNVKPKKLKIDYHNWGMT
jgi:hypothetical protein